MVEHPSSKQDSHSKSRTEPDAVFLKEISTAALANLLITKGILNPAELLQQERALRLSDADDSSSVSSRSKRAGRLRQWASKRRWSRRLTSLVLRWEWKKVHHEKAER